MKYQIINKNAADSIYIKKYIGLIDRNNTLIAGYILCIIIILLVYSFRLFHNRFVLIPGENKLSYALILDVETTGLSPQKHHILTLALIIYDLEKGTIIKQEELIIKPEKDFEISNISMGINKIDINENYKYGISCEKVIEKLTEFLSYKYDCIIGHNLNFDIRFLREYLKDDYTRFLSGRKYKHICTLKILRDLKSCGKYRGTNCQLKTACDYLNIEVKCAHNALSDALVTAELYKKLNNIKEFAVKV